MYPIFDLVVQNQIKLNTSIMFRKQLHKPNKHKYPRKKFCASLFRSTHKFGGMCMLRFGYLALFSIPKKRRSVCLCLFCSIQLLMRFFVCVCVYFVNVCLCANRITCAQFPSFTSVMCHMEFKQRICVLNKHVDFPMYNQRAAISRLCTITKRRNGFFSLSIYQFYCVNSHIPITICNCVFIQKQRKRICVCVRVRLCVYR